METSKPFVALQGADVWHWRSVRSSVVEENVLDDYLRRLLEAVRVTPGAIGCFSLGLMLRDLGVDEGRGNQMWLGYRLRARGWTRHKTWISPGGACNRWFPPEPPAEEV